MEMKTKISKGNSKMGKVMSVSLTPVRSCPKDVPCASRGNCYALKAYVQYPATRNAWDINYEMATGDRVTYFEEIIKAIQRVKPRFFRWHVAGDILDQDYLNWMITIARENPEVKFLAFTKRHDLNYHFEASNLSIVFSMWPTFGDMGKGMPRAWMQDGSEDRVPGDALECFGNCETCGMCWSLKSIGRDVVFHKH
jgi:hypothetical protein